MKKEKQLNGAELALPNTKSMRTLARSLVNHLSMGLIAQGKIDPNLNIEERRKKASELILKAFDEEIPFAFVVDHTSSVLRQAHRFKRQKRNELAILLYATACEHIINSLVVHFAQRAGFGDEQIPQIIRDTNFNARCTWLLALLKGPALGNVHFKRLKLLMDLRNEFVHYKWKYELDGAKSDNRHSDLLEVLPLSIRYLRNYERRHVFHGAKVRSPKKRT